MQIVNAKEAAERMGISVFYVRKLIRSGDLKGYLAGSRRGGYKTTVQAIEEYVNSKMK